MLTLNDDLINYIETQGLEVPCDETLYLKSFVIADVIFTIEYNKDDPRYRRIIKKERYE